MKTSKTTVEDCRVWFHRRRAAAWIGFAATWTFWTSIAALMLLRHFDDGPDLWSEVGSWFMAIWSSCLVAAVARAWIHAHPSEWSAHARLSVEEDELAFQSGGRSIQVSRNSILRGFLVAWGDSLQLRLGGRGRDISVTSSRSSGLDGVATELGLVPGYARNVFVLGNPGRTVLGLPFAFIFFVVVGDLPYRIGVHTPGYVITFFVLAATALTMRALRPVKVEVGVDGVLLRRPFRSVWLPFSEMLDVCVARGGLTVRSKRRAVRVAALRRSDRDWLANELRAIGANRTSSGGLTWTIPGLSPPPLTTSAAWWMWQGKLAYDARPNVQHESSLARGGRTLTDWRQAVELACRTEGYRVSAEGTNHLFDIIEHPGAPLDVRVGAALALHVIEAPGAGERIGAAAGRSAHGETRATLRAASREESLERALRRAART